MTAPILTARASFGEIVLALLVLQPPTHGQAVVNTAVAARLIDIDEAHVAVIDIGPGNSPPGLGYHAIRLRRVIAAVGHAFRHARNPRRTIYTCHEAGWGIMYNFLLVGIGRILGYRLILHHHTSAHILADSRLFRWLGSLAGGQAIHVVLGPSMANDLKRRYPIITNVIIAHNAGIVAVPPEPSPVGSEFPRLKLGLLSNLSDDKGLDIALSVLRAAKSAGLDVVLHLAGLASTAKAAADIATAKQEFGSALDVAGPLSGPAKAAFYKRIDVFLFPSRYRNEAQPLVVLEAMANGLPVIVSNRGYIAELVGTTGVIVADPRAFVSITMELCRAWATNPDEFRHRANGSRERFLELHRIAVADFKSLLGRIVRRNSEEPAKSVP